MSSRRPASGVRYVLALGHVAPDHLIYEGFAHLTSADVPLVARVEVPAGAVRVTATAIDGVAEDRASEIAKHAAPLVRAATKAEIASGQAPPRKIVRWRAESAQARS